MVDDRQRIADNVADVQQRIAAAARRSGRAADDVLLVAVTKYVGVEIVRLLIEAGCRRWARVVRRTCGPRPMPSLI